MSDLKELSELTWKGFLDRNKKALTWQRILKS